MRVAWLTLELLINGLEIVLFIFFTSNRLGVREYHQAWVPVYGIFFFIVLSCVNWLASSPIINAVVSLILAVVFGLLLLKGSINERIYWPVFVLTLIFSIDLATSLIFVNVLNVPLSLILEPTAYRFLLMVLVKLIQLTVIYLLYLKTQSRDSISTLPGWLLFIIPALSIALMFLLLSGETLVRGDNATEWAFALASLVILFLNVLAVGIFSLMAHQNKELIRQRLKLKQLEMQSVFQDELKAIYQEQRKFRHDIKNHLQVMQGLLMDKQYEALTVYLDEICAAQETSEAPIQSGNLIMDTVLNSKILFASSRGIEVKVEEAVYSRGVKLDGMDLTVLLSNLLDNAIEAVERIDDEEATKAVFVTIGPRKSYFMVRITNPTDDKVKFDVHTNRWISAKTGPGHGLGHSIVGDIVKKYDGLLQLNHQNGLFTAQVLLPITDS